MLEEADGFAVLDLRGRRIGFVIGLVHDPESGEQRIAIRRDGVFIWRRRLLPLDAVTSADVERQLVVVDEHRQSTAGVEPDEAAAAVDREATPRAEAEPSLLRRIEPYRRPSDAGTEDEERVADDPESPEPQLPRASNQRHLRFVASPDGYRLAARPGEPPAVGTRISGPDLTEPLVVVKVGPSPLPGDPRPCAFLERDNRLAPPPSS